MPIYEYRCSSCGMQKEFLQKMSDDLLTDCPECGGKGTLNKMLSAAGFQLKGSGWYASDFKTKPAAAAASGATGDAKTEAKTDTKIDTKTDTKTETKTEAAPAAPHVHSSNCSHG